MCDTRQLSTRLRDRKRCSTLLRALKYNGVFPVDVSRLGSKVVLKSPPQKQKPLLEFFQHLQSLGYKTNCADADVRCINRGKCIALSLQHGLNEKEPSLRVHLHRCKGKRAWFPLALEIGDTAWNHWLYGNRGIWGVDPDMKCISCRKQYLHPDDAVPAITSGKSKMSEIWVCCFSIHCPDTGPWEEQVL